MDHSHLPETARDLNEAAELEAQSIFEGAQQEARRLEGLARNLGVSPSDIDFAPGNSALELADATRAEGCKEAVEYLFRSTVVLCWARLKPDVEAFTSELDSLWHAACQKFQVTAPRLLEGSKRNWRVWALRKRAACRPSQPEQPHTGVARPSGVKEAPGARRGYRFEVHRWMREAKPPLRTVPEAARRLGVGPDTLKSIMSSRGTKRYGHDTLMRVLKEIGHSVP
jgi:hypothetical protein